MKSKILTIVLRLLAAPFVLGLLLITHIVFVIKRTWKFIKGGGKFQIELEKELTNE